MNFIVKIALNLLVMYFLGKSITVLLHTVIKYGDMLYILITK